MIKFLYFSFIVILRAEKSKIICTLYAIDNFYNDKLKLLRTKVIPKQGII